MLQKTKHLSVIYHIIEDIFSWEYRTHIALSGDALSCFLYSLDRFSTDICIEIVRKISDELAFQVYIETVLAKHGKIIEISRMWDAFFFTLQYWDIGTHLIIEIHTKIWTENQYEITNIYGLELLAQERSTIFANKLVDITTKKTLSARDIYDLYFYFVHEFPVNQLLIQERARKNTGEYLVYLLDFLSKKVTPETLDMGIENNFDTQQIVFVRDKLLSELWVIVQSKLELL